MTMMPDAGYRMPDNANTMIMLIKEPLSGSGDFPLIFPKTLK